MPAVTMLMLLLAHFLNSLATVYRVTEANELGQHHYVRLAGATAGYYWLSLFIIMLVHLSVQSLVISLLLTIPTADYLLDPFCDMSIGVRWLLILSYSLAICSHSLFVGCVFDKTSHALLVTCLLGSCYAMYAMTIMLQWTPYDFTPFSVPVTINLLNPASNFQALCLVIFAISFQTNEPFNLTHLGHSIIGGGFSDWSVGSLWVLLIAQIIVWLLLAIVVDQMKYSTGSGPLNLLKSLFNELILCNSSSGPSERHVEDIKTKSSSGIKSLMSSHKDPNRICLSMRHVSSKGPTKMVPQTRTNALKLTHEQLQMLRPHEAKNVSKTNQYLIERTVMKHQKEDPILIDEAIQQRVFWFKMDVTLDNLNLDFRFNQISFILGQTDQKELLFSTLLGLRPLREGNIIIDGTKFDSSTMSIARREIGCLGDKDVFYNELTIFENLQLFGSLRDSAYKNFDSESSFVLSLLHLTSRKDDMPSVLTSRSARKLALGVAAVGYTKLLLLVEPTLNLRWRPRCQVLNLLKKYKAIRSVVVDTSDIDEAAAFGDRIVLLKNGRAEFDDTPTRLTKRLCCGYWIVFEPTTGDGRSVNSEAIKALEKLTNEIFKQDKLDLDATRRSVYQTLTGGSTSKVASTGVAASKTDAISGSTKAQDHLHRVIVIVKVRQSHASLNALCTILKMFSQHNIHGFRLAELTYESIEDILVLRMSRAIYPDLPPDLLLSLQHRTQIRQRTLETSPVSVRKFDENQSMRPATSIFGSNILGILKDRLTNTFEIIITLMALIGAALIIIITLLALQASLRPSGKIGAIASGSPMTTSLAGRQATSADDNNNINNNMHFGTHGNIIRNYDIEQLYKYRIGFYVVDDTLARDGTTTSTSAKSYLYRWRGNEKLIGHVSKRINQSDADYVASIIHRSKDLAASFIFFDPATSEATIVFEPYLPHAMFGAIKTFINYISANDDNNNNNNNNNYAYYRSRQERMRSASDANVLLPISGLVDKSDGSYSSRYKTIRHNYHQPWHEMIRGYLNRRFIYGIGFAIAEAITIGVMVFAPIRHRIESKVVRVRVSYWIGMAIFDMSISIILILTYVTLFVVIEGLQSTMVPIIIVLFLYKLATLPIPYIVSLAADSTYNGFLFICLIYATVCWEFTIILRSFVEYALINDSYIYTISSWLLLAVPISSLIDALTVANQVDRIDKLCSQVPAYTTTKNIVPLAGVKRDALIDGLLDKVRECLANGKTGVSTNVLHQQELGILWSIYLILLFGIVGWLFLLTSERFFGMLARRFNSARTSNDPMKTVVRFPDKTSSLFHWDRERDRLISEYIRCMNEIKYVKLMATNCLLIRVWLRPMSDQSSFDRRLSNILEPLYSLGQTKNDVQVELKTTLQIFIRVGDESKRCKLDKIQLIQAYSKYVASNSDTIAKFAVVDWTRETLYKILLHGHYNTKSKASSIQAGPD